MSTPGGRKVLAARSAMAVLQRVADLHRIKGCFGRDVRWFHERHHDQFGWRARHRHE